MTNIVFPNGVVDPGDEVAQVLGFLPELFSGYLFVDNIKRRIYISFIESKLQRQGNFKALCRNIQKARYRVAVPSPLPLMLLIVKKWGYVRVVEYHELAQENISVFLSPEDYVPYVR